MRVASKNLKSILFAVTLVALLVWPFSQAQAAKPRYEYYVAGNPGDVSRVTTPGLVLMGGGTDVDAAFLWMIARSGGGDFVILRASGTDAYNPWVYTDLGGVDSAETLITKNREAAFDPFVVNKILGAEALFIAGGDQSDYVNFWKDTLVEDAIHTLVGRGVPVGGTSAGLAIMGEFVFSAQNGTIDSATALENPYGRRVTLDRNFLSLPNMGGVITDSHFASRDRMGRLVTFLARLVQDGWMAQAKGIGIDERTALLVEPSGAATLVGDGAAYFVRTPGLPQICQPRTALTFQNLSVYRITGSGTFNLATWTGSGGLVYSLSANAGVLTSTQAGGGIY